MDGMDGMDGAGGRRSYLSSLLAGAPLGDVEIDEFGDGAEAREVGSDARAAGVQPEFSVNVLNPHAGRTRLRLNAQREHGATVRRVPQ